MRPREWTLGLVAWATLGCHHRDGEKIAPQASVSVAVPPGRTDIGQAASVEHLIATADLRVEARRAVVHGPDPLLDRHRGELSRQFGDPPYPLSLQVVRAGEGRSALLLQATHGDPRPLVWLVDANFEMVWAKEHPIGGVKPGVSEPAIAAGPEGRVSLSWCNGGTSSVALRQWADDGGAFADYEIMHFDACDALSVLYWPRRGWLVGVAAPAGLSLQLVSENGELRWGRDGMTLPWIWRGAATASFALDTQDSMLLFRLGQSGGAGSAEYVFASRYGPDGRALWPGPVSVKKLGGRVSDGGARIGLAPGKDGAIRVKAPHAVRPAEPAAQPGEARSNDEVVDVASDGTVTLPLTGSGSGGTSPNPSH